MTEQEQKAIKWMQNVRDDAIVTLDHIAQEEPNVSPMLYAGRKEKAETIIKGFEELEQYRKIGTVEECREAVEKNRVEVIQEEEGAICPRCDNFIDEEALEEGAIGFCSICGQAVEIAWWEDEDD